MTTASVRPPALRRLRRMGGWLRRASLRQRLVLLLLPTLLLMTAAELWMTRHDALNAANSAYDRSLLGALRSIDANISLASGGLSVELPYTMFEFFELTANGQVYFRVATSDGLVELGSADLPEPVQPPLSDKPVFYDAVYFGEAVRLAAFRRVLDPAPADGPARSVLVQVGESTRSREAFSARFVRRAALRDALVLLLLTCATALALAAALRPLTRLAREVQERQPDDLTRMDEDALPADIRPLVAAVNQHMGRTQALVTQQRQFLDDTSHQLRTHLTTLQMQVDYALRERHADAVQGTLAAMSVEIGRVTRTTQQLLSLGRSDTAALDMAELDLDELTRSVAIELLGLARSRHIDLGIQPAAPATAPTCAFADAGLMREALRNLIVNAITYTPPHGTVTVYARGTAQECRITVEDDGPGLTDAECAVLGQRFQRGTRAATGGSGLGLAIARSIARRHHGDLLLRPRADAQGLLAILWWPAPQGSTPEASR